MNGMLSPLSFPRAAAIPQAMRQPEAVHSWGHRMQPKQTVFGDMHSQRQKKRLTWHAGKPGKTAEFLTLQDAGEARVE